MQYTNITGSQIIEQVRLLAQERPDHVYRKRGAGRSCGYAGDAIGSTRGEGCIIGQALMRLGVRRADLVSLEGVVSSALPKLGIHRYDTDERNWMSSVQKSQDTWSTWGRSVKDADALVDLGVPS